MKSVELSLAGVKLLEPKIFSDERGWSMESYSTKLFQEMGLHDTAVLRYESYNRQAGTIRGIHFQDGPAAQCKLVQCSKGAIWDVAVDLRVDSPTFKHWVSVELTEENNRMLYLPAGIGHGFATLTDDTKVVYLMDQLYDPEHAKRIAWNDAALDILWPVTAPVLSEKDRCAPALEQCGLVF